MTHLHSIQPAETDGDLLPVVNERDEVIGVQPRRAVHLAGLRHRAVHVVVFDGRGRLWLQKRAATKDLHPGEWDLSATGHVDPGETYDDAARRELREELGIDAAPRFVTRLEATARSGWEFHALYWLPWAGPIDAFNRAEIDAMQPFAIETIRAAIAAPEGAMRLTPCVAEELDWLLHAAGLASRTPSGLDPTV